MLDLQAAMVCQPQRCVGLSCVCCSFNPPRQACVVPQPAILCISISQLAPSSCGSHLCCVVFPSFICRTDKFGAATTLLLIAYPYSRTIVGQSPCRPLHSLQQKIDPAILSRRSDLRVASNSVWLVSVTVRSIHGHSFLSYLMRS